MFLALHRPGLRDRGTVNWTQTGISNTISVYITSNLKKNDIPSSLSCNPGLSRHRAVEFSIKSHMVSYCSVIKLKILITYM